VLGYTEIGGGDRPSREGSHPSLLETPDRPEGDQPGRLRDVTCNPCSSFASIGSLAHSVARGDMTDIFFSYSSADRERVRPIRDALVAQGFEVFWDQQVPPGMDWDTWIRQHLTKSKCAMAFWSATSVSSDNVRHEAMVAKQHGKLISVLLEPLTAEQFPMGLYAQQAANLSGWSGDYSHDEWRKFRREFEAKLTPLWVRRQIDEIEAELVGERTRREGAERRDRTMQVQIAKEVEVQQLLKRERDYAFDEVDKLKATVEELARARSEAAALQAQMQQDLKQGRDKALDEVAALKATVEELTQVRTEGEARQAAAQRRDAALRAQIAKEVEGQQALKRARDGALDEVVALKGTVEELTRAREHAEARTVELSQRLSKVRQAKAKEIVRSMGATLSLFVIAAAVATVGFWTYQLIWSAPQPVLAVATGSTPEAEQQRLAAIEEAQRQAKAAGDAEAKLKAAEVEQQRLRDEVQRQTKAAADAEAKRKAAEVEQQRQTKAAADADSKRKAAEAERDEVQRQAKEAADAETKRKAAEVEQQRLAALKAEPFSVTKGAAPRRRERAYQTLSRVMSLEACSNECGKNMRCQMFAYWTNQTCDLFEKNYSTYPDSAAQVGVRREGCPVAELC